MKYLSVCSGIEAASVAWHGLGYKPVGFSEIEKFPATVLNTRFPNVPNFGDMIKYQDWNIDNVDLLVGGTPCQSFSVAGLRKGLSDPRGNLALVYCGILEKFRPQWFVWENVPGVLSSSGGRDFGSFLGAVAQLGYGFAYRVLDAQFFGVPQRRRRVFVVGCFGDWRRAAKVLLEPEGMFRNTPKGESKRKEDSSISKDGVERISKSVLTKQRLDSETETFIACIKGAAIGRKPENGPQFGEISDKSYTLNATEVHAIGGDMGVRRLTPLECERLQGFPDDWTLIDYRGKPSADGPRYKAIGNSMAVPVMRWIGLRIKANWF